MAASHQSRSSNPMSKGGRGAWNMLGCGAESRFVLKTIRRVAIGAKMLLDAGELTFSDFPGLSSTGLAGFFRLRGHRSGASSRRGDGAGYPTKFCSTALLSQSFPLEQTWPSI